MIYYSDLKEFDGNEGEFLDLSNFVFKSLSLSVKNFSLNIVRRGRIKMLDKQYFDINIQTDVIALEYKNGAFSEIYIGDIFICPAVIYRSSIVYNVEFMDEIRRSFVHGLLHLLGYDHKTPLNNQEEMFKIQEKILMDFKK